MLPTKQSIVAGLVCCLYFAVFFNHQQDPSIAILVGTGMLTVWAWVSGGVHKNWCLDALEGLFALNLIITAHDICICMHGVIA